MEQQFWPGPLCCMLFFFLLVFLSAPDLCSNMLVLIYRWALLEDTEPVKQATSFAVVIFLFKVGDKT